MIWCLWQSCSINFSEKNCHTAKENLSFIYLTSQRKYFQFFEFFRWVLGDQKGIFCIWKNCELWKNAELRKILNAHHILKISSRYKFKISSTFHIICLFRFWCKWKYCFNLNVFAEISSTMQTFFFKFSFSDLLDWTAGHSDRAD